MPHRLDGDAREPPSLIAVIERMEEVHLTPRQREIAWGVLCGLRNKEIAVVMGTSVSTVKNQLRDMYSRAGVQDRLQLVLRLLGLR